MSALPEPPADATTRFSDRVADYVAHRPGYPAELFAWLVDRAGLRAGSPVADVGAGTGIFAAGLLDHGCTVSAVEPNADMRSAAVSALGSEPRFTAIDGTAEATGLPDGSVALVVAAQAAHWFHLDACAVEWRRVLRPGGAVALVWNRRDPEASPFMAAYEALLLERVPAYGTSSHRRLGDEGVAAFLGPEAERIELPNHQVLDRAALLGRVLSSSYAPKPDQEGHAALRDGLDDLHGAHAVDGRVRVAYRCTAHLARWA